MTRVTYTIGQGETGEHTPIPDVLGRRAQAFYRTASEFGGYTSWDAQGAWMDDQARLVVEPSLMIEVLTDVDADRIKSHGEYLAQLFEQASVLVATSGASVSFVAPNDAIAVQAPMQAPMQAPILQEASTIH